MVKISHIYSRLGGIRNVYEGLEDAVNKSIQWGNDAVKEDFPGFDWGEVQERTEELYGAAFVVAQSFLSGELKWLSTRSTQVSVEKFIQYLRDHSAKVGNMDVSHLELVIALANAYKHKEEWNDNLVVNIRGEWQREWEVDGRNKSTIAILEKVGITAHDFFPCVLGVYVLTEQNHENFFQTLYNDLVHWRNELVKLDGGSHRFALWVKKS